MKLYVYDHCPFCTKARMIFGLKQVPLELEVLLEDDVETPTKLVGKKTAPILDKKDGSHMAESMDVVHYIDQLHGKPIVTSVENSQINAWHDAAWRPILDLAIPRLGQSNMKEFATPEAREAFRTRQTKNFGDFDDLIARSPELVSAVEAQLKDLDPLLAEREHVDADDFVLYPSLRMLSIVKGVNYPENVRRYLDRMELSTGVPLHTGLAM